MYSVKKLFDTVERRRAEGAVQSQTVNSQSVNSQNEHVFRTASALRDRVVALDVVQRHGPAEQQAVVRRTRREQGPAKGASKYLLLKKDAPWHSLMSYGISYNDTYKNLGDV